MTPSARDHFSRTYPIAYFQSSYRMYRWTSIANGRTFKRYDEWLAAVPQRTGCTTFPHTNTQNFATCSPHTKNQSTKYTSAARPKQAKTIHVQLSKRAGIRSGCRLMLRDGGCFWVQMTPAVRSFVKQFRRSFGAGRHATATLASL